MTRECVRKIYNGPVSLEDFEYCPRCLGYHSKHGKPRGLNPTERARRRKIQGVRWRTEHKNKVQKMSEDKRERVSMVTPKDLDILDPERG
jgi:hypothetical protein